MNTKRHDILALLAENDSNGCYTDADCLAEIGRVLSIDEIVGYVRQMLIDDDSLADIELAVAQLRTALLDETANEEIN